MASFLEVIPVRYRLVTNWITTKGSRHLTSLMTLVYLSPPFQGLKCNWIIP